MSATGMVGTARLAFVALALLLLLPAVPSNAATFKPTRFDDPAPNGCKPGDCSLREAITRANNRDGKDRVLVPAGKYGLELPEDGTDDNDNGDLDVVGEVVIKGEGPRRTRIDGNGVGGVFSFLTFSPHALKRVTVRGGTVGPPAGGAGGVGTGPSPLTLADVVIKRNIGGNGGGLRSVSPDLQLRRVSIERNEATGDGGGVFLGVSVADVEASIVNSTIARNDAAGNGGGIAADATDTIGDPNSQVVEVENSTLADNAADGPGGGVAGLGGTTLTLDHATVSHNRAEDDGAGGSDGGGIFSSASAFTVFDSIVAHNSVGVSGSDAQCSGAFLGSGNVLTTPTGCGAFSDGPDKLVSDARIQTLDRNGGPTKTVKLRMGSPAIGFSTSCPPRDQRGEPRPKTGCDTGAFERQGP